MANPRIKRLDSSVVGTGEYRFPENGSIKASGFIIINDGTSKLSYNVDAECSAITSGIPLPKETTDVFDGDVDNHISIFFQSGGIAVIVLMNPTKRTRPKSDSDLANTVSKPFVG